MEGFELKRVGLAVCTSPLRLLQPRCPQLCPTWDKQFKSRTCFLVALWGSEDTVWDFGAVPTLPQHTL
ncbi:hypothetical protein HPG69_010080 [Diceros bicornis minor]|uniref:Uncharacterized protein n=1 Tax=Diceros bicornis minor TaxID=77932 RepID=A0A7J7EQE7_DICBM|nr:hypothetical protein HPG69_010080 [Diceros bicornis minor]